MTQRLVDWFSFVIGPQVDVFTAIKGEINKLPIVRPHFGMEEVEKVEYDLGYLYFKKYIQKLKEYTIEAEKKCISRNEALNLLVKQAVEKCHEILPQYQELNYDTMPEDIKKRLKNTKSLQEETEILSEWVGRIGSENG